MMLVMPEMDDRCRVSFGVVCDKHDMKCLRTGNPGLIYSRKEENHRREVLKKYAKVLIKPQD